jgi:hypothetical protein
MINTCARMPKAPGVVRFWGVQMFRFDLNAKPFDEMATRLARVTFPDEAVKGLNDTAYEGLRAIQDRMRVEFDRPTRFALNAFMVWRATKTTMVAEIKERPSVGRRHFLKVQERGGSRPATGLERSLKTRLGYQGVIEAVTPASGARLDAFGNWSMGERNQVLSQLNAQSDAQANQTEVSKRRNKGRRATYFVPRNGGLSPGVWKRDTPGGAPVKVLNFLDVMPSYGRKLGFEDVVERVWRERLGPNIAKALTKAVARAK